MQVIESLFDPERAAFVLTSIRFSTFHLLPAM